MGKKETVLELKKLAIEQRRRLVELSESYSGGIHLGGDMSSSDVLVALFHYGMHVDSSDIAMPDRDRFVLSKGHAAVCMYVTMSIEGFFDFEEIKRTYGQLDSAYGMHPCKIHLPGVECSTGSLGQGFPMATGMAIMAKQQKQQHRVFCLMGDGETCEGSVWETAMFAGSQNLNNLVAVVDRNHQMMTSYTEDKYMNLEPYADKWRAFRWHVIELSDGNDMEQIVDAIDEVKAYKGTQPVAIICNTLKGKGISFMEHAINWHSGSLNSEQAAICYAELEKERESLK